MIPSGFQGMGYPVDDHKRGMFAEPDQSPMAKRLAVENPEYQAAFKMFDRDNSGSIDIMELSGALAAVKQSVEQGTARTMFATPFNASTVLFLAAKYGISAYGQPLLFQQFAEMLQYLEGIKQIFQQIDIHHTGDLDVSELSRALSLSGFNVTGAVGGSDCLSQEVARQIGQAYDADGNGVLTFDEFVQMRCEWDTYISVWNTHVAPGANRIEPAQLLAVMTDIKNSLEPIGIMAQNPAITGMAGFNVAGFSGLVFNSMFQAQKQFSQRTCEMLIIRFGCNSIRLTWEQFCMLMEFLKQQKKIFSQFDLDRSGKLHLQELHNAFNVSGIPMPPEAVMQIGRRYDADNSGAIEFDEFLQMMAEWTQVSMQQGQFANFAQQRASAYDLQTLFPAITMWYHTVNGTIPAVRAFSLNVCRALVAMYGTALPGEPFATGVTYQEYLLLMQRVKLAAMEFANADILHDGSISAAELQIAMRRCGSSLPDVAIQGLLASHDFDRDGRISFDEFLQMLMDAELINTRIQNFAVPGVDASRLFQLMYSMPRTVFR